MKRKKKKIPNNIIKSMTKKRSLGRECEREQKRLKGSGLSGPPQNFCQIISIISFSSVDDQLLGFFKARHYLFLERERSKLAQFFSFFFSFNWILFSQENDPNSLYKQIKENILFHSNVYARTKISILTNISIYRWIFW